MTEMSAELINPTVLRVFEALADPVQAVAVKLVGGAAAGKFDLQHALFPPQGIHRNSVPAHFTARIGFIANYRFELMVSLVHCFEDGDVTVLGLISYDQRQRIELETAGDLDPTKCWVGVRYSVNRREGKVFFFKEIDSAVRKCLDLDDPLHDRDKDYPLPG